MKIILACLLSVVSFAQQVNATTSFDVDSFGQLTGINGIDMLGGRWDVDFLDGTAISIWGSNLEFDFTSKSEASVASNSLLTLFNTNPYAQWSDTPANIRGIISSSAQIWTPYAVGSFGTIVEAEIFVNYGAPRTDKLSSFWFGIQEDMSVNGENVFAVWTSVSAVPIPSTVLFMGSALLSLLGFSRKPRDS